MRRTATLLLLLIPCSASADNARSARMAICSEEQDHRQCADVGREYESAWKNTQDNQMLEEAVVAYATACETRRQFSRINAHIEAQPIDDCVHATELAEAGAALGLPRSTHNRGALEYNARNFADAMRWFQLGYQRGFAKSAYAIATMYEHGQGVSKDGQEALAWYERAASLKEAAAADWLKSYWFKSITHTFDAARVNEALGKLKNLGVPEDRLGSVHDRLAAIDSVRRNATGMPRLAAKPMSATFCPGDSEFYGNQQWRIFAVTRVDQLNDSYSNLTVAAAGEADNAACIHFNSNALAGIRKALAEGSTLVLNWPGRRVLLSAKPDSRGTIKFSLDKPVEY